MLRKWNELPIAGIPFLLSTEYKTGSWRVEKPVIDLKKCTRCGICWLFCPEESINWIKDSPQIDYDYCKGCGICAEECPVKAIVMVKE